LIVDGDLVIANSPGISAEELGRVNADKQGILQRAANRWLIPGCRRFVIQDVHEASWWRLAESREACGVFAGCHESQISSTKLVLMQLPEL
jgi:hypothetical protein